MADPWRILAVLFDAVGTLILLREPVGETYARVARRHGVQLPASPLGSVYTERGDYPKPAQQYEGALRLQREHLGESHPDTLRSLYGLVMARWWNGDLAQAEPLTRQGLEISRRALGEKNPLTLQFMQARAFVMMILGEMPWTESNRSLSKPWRCTGKSWARTTWGR